MEEDKKIISYQELRIPDSNLRNTILMCNSCENLLQMKHTRWAKSYLPGIRVAICEYCTNFRFSPVEKIGETFVMFHHQTTGIFTTKFKTSLNVKVPNQSLEIFK